MRTSAQNYGIVWARLLAITAVIVTVLYAPNARAAAPMCGPHAESVLAPPILMPPKDSVLRAELPCEGPLDQLLTGTPAPSNQQQITMQDAPLRALPFLTRVPPLPLVGRQPAQAETRADESGDFQSSVYRPPRS